MLFDHPYRALVIGARGSIGSAFVAACESDHHCACVKLVSRSPESDFDVTDQASIERHASLCAVDGPYHLIVDATGALQINGKGPEKSLAALDAEQLQRSFQVNAIGPIMVLQRFAPLLAPGRSIYAKLSARLGSISDNQIGGWYGYRASKAAVNMLLQTAAIELQRVNPQLLVAALQPGTVRSKLSAPYASRVANLLEPQIAAAGLIEALGKLKPRRGAHFIDYRGREIPW